MNLLLDIKLCIASFDVDVWLKLYMIDEEVRNYTLKNNHFHTLFQHKMKRSILRISTLMLICSHIDDRLHLCKVTSVSCGGYGKRRKYHYMGRCIFTGRMYEMLCNKETIIYVYK